MSETASHVLDELARATLATGELYRFADWPNADVPHVAYGVYTVVAARSSAALRRHVGTHRARP